MNLAVLCDFDGTIITIDTAEHVLAKFAQGDWQFFDKQYQQGQITLEECLRKQFSMVKASKEEILDALERVVTIRQGFVRLARYCEKNVIPCIIVSAGLDFVINHFLKFNDLENLVETYTAKTRFKLDGINFTFPKPFDPTSVNFKQDLVRNCKTRGKKVVYVGDGQADYPAAMEADYPFAIKDSRLAKLCKNTRTRCVVISDFTEVVEAIRKIVA